MGVSFDETLREADEGSGCTRGGARFRVEKRQRIGDPVEIETQDCEVQPHGTKQPYTNEEGEQT